MAKNIEGITEKLEQGLKNLLDSESWKEYLKTLSRFHQYSFNNCILIKMQYPEASRVAGYKTWQSMGRQVRKGEKAISILAPCPHKKTIEVEKEDGTIELKAVSFTTYRAVNVFDIKQTDGKELPTVCNSLTGDVEGYERLRKVLAGVAPVPVEDEDIKGGAHGYYSFTDSRIAIKRGMSEAQTIKTTVHEIAHSMMHGANCDREQAEVEAESVAYTVCQYLGIDSGDYSFGYLAGWSDGNMDALKKSLAAIQKTAHTIIEGIEKGLAA